MEQHYCNWQHQNHCAAWQVFVIGVAMSLPRGIEFSLYMYWFDKLNGSFTTLLDS
jgi:hypothetical protein